MNIKNPEVFKFVYDRYYNIYLTWMGIPETRYYYLHRELFFPNRIDLVLEYITQFHTKLTFESMPKILMMLGFESINTCVKERTLYQLLNCKIYLDEMGGNFYVETEYTSELERDRVLGLLEL